MRIPVTHGTNGWRLSFKRNVCAVCGEPTWRAIHAPDNGSMIPLCDDHINDSTVTGRGLLGLPELPHTKKCQCVSCSNS